MNLPLLLIDSDPVREVIKVMSIVSENFPSVRFPGKYDNVSKKYTVTGEGGLKAEILTYGARIFRLYVPDRNGETADVVLGPKDLDGYLADGANHGAVVGRSANRIADASFTIDGVTYNLPQNDGTNNLHTGDKAYQNKFWAAKVLSSEDSYAYVKNSGIRGLCDNDMKMPSDESLLLCCDSADGECGFPGNLKTQVLYYFSADGTFTIIYMGLSDKKTVFAPTNHAYFNLAGHDKGNVGHQILTMDCDKVTLKVNRCPNGEYIDVEGTPFDFREGAPVSKCLDLTYPQIGESNGIDQNFCLKNNGAYALVASLEDKEAGRLMETWTDLPGVQLYCGNHLGGDGFKDGASYKPYDALCIEAQMYPNAVNVPSFESPVINAGEPCYHVCGYRFC